MTNYTYPTMTSRENNALVSTFFDRAFRSFTSALRAGLPLPEIVVSESSNEAVYVALEVENWKVLPEGPQTSWTRRGQWERSWVAFHGRCRHAMLDVGWRYTDVGKWVLSAVVPLDVADTSGDVPELACETVQFPTRHRTLVTADGQLNYWSFDHGDKVRLQGISLSATPSRATPIVLLWRPASTDSLPFDQYSEHLQSLFAAYVDSSNFAVFDLGRIDHPRRRERKNSQYAEVLIDTIQNGERTCRSLSDESLESLGMELAIPPQALAGHMQAVVDEFGPLGHVITANWPVDPLPKVPPLKCYTGQMLSEVRRFRAEMSLEDFAEWLGMETQVLALLEGESGFLKLDTPVLRLLAMVEAYGRLGIAHD